MEENSMKLTVVLVMLAILFVVTNTFAKDEECLCIPTQAVKKYFDKEFASLVKSETKLKQEAIASRDIERLIQQDLEAGEAKDSEADARNLTDDFTIEDLDGKLWTRAEVLSGKGASKNNYEGILQFSDRSWIKIEALTLKGIEAIVYTNQHFVRSVPDRKDGSPHELITNIIHREIWIFTEMGWKMKHIEELERGKTYLNGEVFEID
jgi:flagellar biosynthesis regulator FlaF